MFCGRADILTLPKAVVVGLAGLSLTPQEAELLTEFPPAGIILFARNCETKQQVKQLVDDVRQLFPDRWLPVLIDQEGGRVRRLKAPEWCGVPAPSKLVAASQGDLDQAKSLIETWARLLSSQLTPLGVDVDCAPVLDIVQADTTEAIADRCFCDDPELAAELGGVAIETFRSCGVVPTIKHLPGHGRAKVDSHHLLPKIECGLQSLRAIDFHPFRACGHAPFAMTAHIVIPEVDSKRPATQSPVIIKEIIRGEIGFEGILFSDDLSMEALDGPIEQRADRAVAAGCDLALHCNGKLEEMRAVLKTVTTMPEDRFILLQKSKPQTSSMALDEIQLASTLQAALTIQGH